MNEYPHLRKLWNSAKKKFDAAGNAFSFLDDKIYIQIIGSKAYMYSWDYFLY